MAEKLDYLKDQNISVIALTRGGAIVGAQIAMRLHGNMMLLLTENIMLPGEIEAIGSVSSAGDFTYNSAFSQGELDEFTGEFRQYIESQRREKLHKLNILIGEDGEINPDQLRHHVVILVSDGIYNGTSLDIANDFLRRIAIKKMVIAVPIAGVAGIDRMHLVGDEICCLSVAQNFINTDHYYDDNTVPGVDDLFRMMKQISLNWKQ